MAKRSINKPIILITQSDKFPFISRDFLEVKNSFRTLAQKNKEGPPKKHYVDKSGSIYQKISLPKKYTEKRKPVQEIKVYHVLKNGLYETEQELLRLPNKLYLQFIKADSDKKLSRFIDKYNFCDFPNLNKEMENINDPYINIFTPRKKSRGVNWLHIYRKQFKLNNVYENWKNNNLTLSDKNYLQEEISKNVASFFFDKNSLPFKEIDNFEIEYNLSISELLGFDGKKNFDQVEGYVVFGHYALCCLELLKDIENQKQRFCMECHEPLPINAHGNQKRCIFKDNPKCYRRYRAKARRNERKKEKLIGKKERKFKPKRNYL